MNFKKFFLAILMTLSLNTTAPIKACDNSCLPVILAGLAGAWYGAIVTHHHQQGKDKNKTYFKRFFHKATAWSMVINALRLESLWLSNGDVSKEQAAAAFGYVIVLLDYCDQTKAVRQ